MNRFTFSMMNYPIDPLLDNYLTTAMKSGIKSITSFNQFHVKVLFNDGSELIGWNVNKYYAWMSQGVFTFPNGNDGYIWKNGRPKRSTMAKLLKMFESVNYNNA